jgi:hypothetical protein
MTDTGPVEKWTGLIGARGLPLPFYLRALEVRRGRRLPSQAPGTRARGALSRPRSSRSDPIALDTAPYAWVLDLTVGERYLARQHS